jgi:putative transposase
MWYYELKRDDSEVIAKLNVLAEELPTRGFDSYYGRIRAEGLKWNRKRVLRIYRMLKLNIRRKRKRRLPARIKQPLTQPLRPNESWSADFMSDALENGRRIRTFNMIDDFNREALSVEAKYSYPAEEVIRTIERVAFRRGYPRQIRVDNGPEFISQTFHEYCKDKGIRIQYIQPGKPTQNAYIERFNRLYREDVLDAYVFSRIKQILIVSEKWMDDYNGKHPHKSLGNISPNQFKYLYDQENNSSESVKAKMNDSLQSSALTDSPQLSIDRLREIKPDVIT